jgi:predicted SprT family Zn-dependent metalloprotease
MGVSRFKELKQESAGVSWTRLFFKKPSFLFNSSVSHLVCEKCGTAYLFQRIIKDGERARRYYCPGCGNQKILKRIRSRPVF